MRRCLTFGAGVLLAAVVGADLGAARAGTSATNLDRTFLCTTTRTGGFSGIHASAYPRGELVGFPAVGMVTTAGGAAETLTAVQAGPGTGGIAMNVNTKRCNAVRARVPLGPDALSGGTPTGGDATCPSPVRFLVHVHLVTTGRVTWTTQPPFRIAHGDVLEAAVAVRATARKPLAYFKLDRKAFAHFYSAASCY